jgi:hypothetical protein
MHVLPIDSAYLQHEPQSFNISKLKTPAQWRENVEKSELATRTSSSLAKNNKQKAHNFSWRAYANSFHVH